MYNRVVFCYEGMLQDIFYGNSLLWNLFQNLKHQILYFVTAARTEPDFPFFDVIVNLDHGLALERALSVHQFVQENSQASYVYFFVVRSLVKNFRGDVLIRAAKRAPHWISLLLVLGTPSEIAQLYRSLFIEEEVFRLHVPVDVPF